MIDSSPGLTPPLSAEDRRLLVSYDNYAAAQRAVDMLSDAGYPVQNVAIVGSDLRLEERVTGRVTNPRAAGAGAVNGLVFGLIVGLFLGLFTSTSGSFFALVVWAGLWGAIVGAAFGFANHAFKGGARDFSSRSALVAGRYDVLVPGANLDEAIAVLEGGLRPADTVVVQRPTSGGPFRTHTPSGSSPGATGPGTAGAGSTADGSPAPRSSTTESGTTESGAAGPRTTGPTSTDSDTTGTPAADIGTPAGAGASSAVTPDSADRPAFSAAPDATTPGPVPPAPPASAAMFAETTPLGTGLGATQPTPPGGDGSIRAATTRAEAMEEATVAIPMSTVRAATTSPGETVTDPKPTTAPEASPAAPSDPTDSTPSTTAADSPDATPSGSSTTPDSPDATPSSGPDSALDPVAAAPSAPTASDAGPVADPVAEAPSTPAASGPDDVPAVATPGKPGAATPATPDASGPADAESGPAAGGATTGSTGSSAPEPEPAGSDADPLIADDPPSAKKSAKQGPADE
ncbi:general stress protein [Sphaerisporangium sp. TRM90804]|uniref:general stress protein n=1 Tax=Sphaerisporangium sp. TRM90804 TaxID=3031113 RepID=UPI002447C714|nr:general stress protein [Sphaerisporangium sp. TRM90804]MDH2428195.1 hypothetical protein [Sphaerisporangium sp. TRM90804]